MGDYEQVISLCSRTSLVLLFLLSVAGCDSAERVGVRASSGALPQRDGESLELESCASSSDCQGSLRCLEQQCQLSTRSRLGDFYSALGRRALIQGDHQAAAQSYNDAITTYAKESLRAPLSLLCEQGIALAKGRDDRPLAEAAARILHKCVLAVPASSGVAKQAMDALALLRDVGLDANLLARTTAADLYMSGAPSGPDMSTLRVTVEGDGKTKKRSYEDFLGMIQSAENQDGFQRCWQESWKKHKEERLDVTLQLGYSFKMDEDDEARDRAVIKVQIANTGSSSADSAQCVQQIVAETAREASKKFKQDTRWKASVRVGVASP